MLDMNQTRNNPRVDLHTARCSGFTLIELLVVISIIALLIGILIPTLGAARRRNRTVACAANVRSIGQVLQMYADDYKQWHPVTSDWQLWEGDGSTPDEPGLGWTELLRAYVNSPAVFLDKERPDVPFAYFLQARYPIALATASGVQLTPGRQLAVYLPTIQFGSQFVVAGDCVNSAFFPSPYGTANRTPNCDLDDGEYECAFPDGALDPHRGVVNIVFADNHVTGAKGFDAATMTWHGREMRDWQSTR